MLKQSQTRTLTNQRKGIDQHKLVFALLMIGLKHVGDRKQFVLIGTSTLFFCKQNSDFIQVWLQKKIAGIEAQTNIAVLYEELSQYILEGQFAIPVILHSKLHEQFMKRFWHQDDAIFCARIIRLIHISCYQSNNNHREDYFFFSFHFYL